MSELRSGTADQNGAVTSQSGSLLYLVSEDMKTSCQAVLDVLGKSVTPVQESTEKGVHPERSHKRKLELAQEAEEKEKREKHDVSSDSPIHWGKDVPQPGTEEPVLY